MKRFVIAVLTIVLLLLILIAVSLKSGTVETSWKELADIFADPDGFPAVIILELRLVRILAAIISGGAFAVAGVILQKVLHNELASPDILGISSGAGCAGIFLIIFFPQLTGFLNFAAFSGALTAAGLICVTAWRKTLSPVRVILAGVALGALFSTAASGILLANPEKFTGIMEFTIGGFSTVSMRDINAALPFCAIGFALAAFLPRRLELLSLGSHEAYSLGLPVNFSRFLALTAAALLAASAVSLSGLLGFVGLISPHIAAKLLDSGHSGKLMVISCLTGMTLTLLADTLSRTLFSPRELPAGIFLSGIGAVFFLILLLKHWGKDEY